MSRGALIKTVLLVDLLVVLLVAGYFLRPKSVEDTSAAVNSVEGFSIYPQPIAIPDFSLTDQSDADFSRQNLQGAWTLLFFGFTSCEDVCPLTLAELKRFTMSLQEGPYATDTRVIMVSVDPQRDNPAVLAEYMGRFDPGYIGLTGPLAEISALADSLYITRMDPPANAEDHSQHGHNYQVQHSAHIAMLDPEGHYRAVLSAPHQSSRIRDAYLMLRSAHD